MSTLETKKIEPLSGTSVTLGAAGDAVTMPAGVTVKTNTVKDAGGNTLWTSDGSGTLSSVNSGLTGGMIFISSQTATGVSTVNFTTGIDSTYNEYVFYFYNCHPSSSSGTHFNFQGSTDGGSNYNVTMTTTIFRAAHKEDDSSAGVAYMASYDQAQGTAYQMLGEYVDGSQGDGSIAGELHLYNPSSTTYVKHFTATTQMYNYFPSTDNNFTAGYFNTTSAINAISFKFTSGTIDAGTIAMYGIR